MSGFLAAIQSRLSFTKQHTAVMLRDVFIMEAVEFFMLISIKLTVCNHAIMAATFSPGHVFPMQNR
jgi:hypothetical protein